MIQRYSLIVESNSEKEHATVSAVALLPDGEEHTVTENITHDDAVGMSAALQQSFQMMLNAMRGGQNAVQRGA